MIEQLRGNGVKVKLKHAATKFGRFACLNNPENNHIELWQPSSEVLSKKFGYQQAIRVGSKAS